MRRRGERTSAPRQQAILGAVLDGLARACKLARCRGGSIATEFALTAPVVITLVYGVVEIGRVVYARTILQYAAEEAVRYAVVNPSASDATITTKVSESAFGLDSQKLSVTITREAATSAAPEYVTIVTNYDFTFVFPIISAEALDFGTRSRFPVVQP